MPADFQQHPRSELVVRFGPRYDLYISILSINLFNVFIASTPCQASPDSGEWRGPLYIRCPLQPVLMPRLARAYPSLAAACMLARPRLKAIRAAADGGRRPSAEGCWANANRGPLQKTVQKDSGGRRWAPWPLCRTRFAAVTFFQQVGHRGLQGSAAGTDAVAAGMCGHALIRHR